VADRTAGTLEPGQVRAMFDRIAGPYDAMNTLMTAGLHHRWRARAADLARVAPGSRVLDVATGTGDLAIELARRVAPGGEVVGSDFAEAMLARARTKGRSARDRSGGPLMTDDGHAGNGRVAPGVLSFEWGDALELPYGDDSFDAATVGFGARNFASLSGGVAEMTRVVRPGGRVVILDFTTPHRQPLSLFYSVWFDRVVPAIGWTAGAVARLTRRNRPASGGTIADAYAYLPSSVKRFPAPLALARELELAGLRDIVYLTTAGGIVAIHAGTVPAERP